MDNNNNNTNKVEVVDINMTFVSMVVFMVKAAIASIPAMIILIVFGSAVFVVLGGVLMGR